MTLIRGGDKAGRDPTIEPADDTFSIGTQEPDELLLVLGLDGQDVDKGGDLFRHLYGRVHDVLLQVVLCPYTMKTILLVTTDRSGKKKDVDCLESASTTMSETLRPNTVNMPFAESR